MGDAELLELARAAGIHTQWNDYRGRQQTVAIGTLQKILAALDVRAEDSAQAQRELRRLREQQRNAPLLVGRLGEPVALPFLEQQSVPAALRIVFENGAELNVVPRHAGGDRYSLPGVEQPGYHRVYHRGGDMALALAPARRECGHALFERKRWALAVQLYGLRSAGGIGIGDFTALAELAGLAAGHGAAALAISPVHAQFSADLARFSPYSPSSRLFFNALHIDVARASSGAALRRDIKGLELGASLRELEAAAQIDWPRASRLKLALLRKAWQRFAPTRDGNGAAARSFRGFREAGGAALENHARFELLHALQFGADPERWHWRTWPAELRDPNSRAVCELAERHRDEVDFHIYLQWLADAGLADAQRAAREAGMAIGLITDLAVGTDSGGSHGWGHQRDMLNGLSIGAPPDLINSRGQNWGLTTFSPQGLREHGYTPFIEMLRSALRHAGGVRIDHVLGLRRLWVVPEGCAASEGAYLDYPFEELSALIALEAWRHDAVIVGEDLGTVPEGFRGALADACILGMEVLWFERDHGLFIHPSRWSDTAIATTSTHDLPTVAGWWCERDIDENARLGHFAADRDELQQRVEREDDRIRLWNAFVHAEVARGEPPPKEETSRVVDAALQFVAMGPSPVTVVPMEDLLGLAEQPNLPGTIDEHPNWRRRLPDVAERLLERPEVEDRLARLRK